MSSARGTRQVSRAVQRCRGLFAELNRRHASSWLASRRRPGGARALMTQHERCEGGSVLVGRRCAVLRDRPVPRTLLDLQGLFHVKHSSDPTSRASPSSRRHPAPQDTTEAASSIALVVGCCPCAGPFVVAPSDPAHAARREETSCTPSRHWPGRGRTDGRMEAAATRGRRGWSSSPDRTWFHVEQA